MAGACSEKAASSFFYFILQNSSAYEWKGGIDTGLLFHQTWRDLGRKTGW